MTAPFNLDVEQRPAAVVLAAGEQDVVAAVKHAVERGLRIAPRATGHGAGPLGSLEDAMLLDLSGLDEVSIDVAARRVRVGAGVTWGAVTPQLSEHGLAALHGSSPGVGIVGYSLAGGLGWLARRHGLQAGSVTAIELVTAEGRLVRTDAGHEPELFWALRGGGGNFGVVTAIEFAVHPVPELYAGAMFFDRARAAEVLHAWTEQLAAFPDELTSWASLVRLPDAPHIPTEVRGGAFAVVSGAFLGSEADARDLLRPLRALRPEHDTFAIVPPLALGGLAMDPPRPVAYRSVHRLLGELPAAAIDDLLGAASDPALAKVQLRHTGGALGRRLPGAGALAGLPGELSLFALGLTAGAEPAAAVESSLEALDSALGPYSAGVYSGFAERPEDASRFFDPHTLERLRRVKAVHDPDGRFVASPRILPASPSAVVRPVDELRWGSEVVLFEGRPDGIETSVYVTTFEQGHGPRLHRHPYPEVFLVQDGHARFHVAGDRHDVGAGHFVVVAPETPHRYENVGARPLTVVSVHPSGVVLQENLVSA